MPLAEELRAFVRDRAALNAVLAPTHRALMLGLTAINAATFRPGEALLDSDAPFPRVVVDGCAFHATSGGIPRLWDAILAQWSDSDFARQVVVLDRGGSAPRHAGITYRPMPLLRAHDSSAERTMIQRACDAERADVFVSTLYSMPLTTPTLLYVHDMTPENLGKDMSIPLHRDKIASIATAAGIVCLTHATADDLRRFVPEASGRIVDVIHPGVQPRFRPAPGAEIDALRERYGLPERYFLFLGHRGNYKNAPLVFDALRELLDSEAGLDGVGLLALGGASTLEPRYADVAARMPVRIARLSDEELRAAYTGAAALLFASRNEGFGLPMIEAMACGCPVIACDSAGVREAGGDAPTYTDPYDASAFAAAMRAALLGEDSNARQETGFAHAARFDWSRSAGQLQEALGTVARAGR